jgi:hypothetical protein
MTEQLEKLCNAGFSAYLHGFSAIDSWLGLTTCKANGQASSKNNADIQILTNADVSDLAKLFEDVRYPGIKIADAALD